MKKTLLLMIGLCVLAMASPDSTAVVSPFTAKIRPDTSQAYIAVSNLTLRMEYKGYGLYLPTDYPILTMIPLDNGEMVHFQTIQEITLHGERVQWKKFVAPDERGNYSDVDADGYRRYSDVEVIVDLKDWNGKITQAMLKRPENSDVYFEGKTERGNYRLQIDQENNKTVNVQFLKSFSVQCTGDPTHVFENAGFSFCPICGKPLNKVDKVEANSSVPK